VALAHSQPPRVPFASSPDAWAAEAAQFLDVEVEEFAWMIAFVANDRGSQFQIGQTLQAVAAEDAGDGGLGDADHGEDLSVGTALATQSDDVRLDFGSGLARLPVRDRRAVVELGGEASGFRACEPFMERFSVTW
jgi:hypothetical protein